MLILPCSPRLFCPSALIYQNENYQTDVSQMWTGDVDDSIAEERGLEHRKSSASQHGEKTREARVALASVGVAGWVWKVVRAMCNHDERSGELIEKRAWLTGVVQPEAMAGGGRATSGRRGQRDRGGIGITKLPRHESTKREVGNRWWDDEGGIGRRGSGGGF